MHVDLFRNDWHTRRQIWLGRVVMDDGGHINIEATDARLCEVLEETIWSPTAQSWVKPSEGAAFLNALHVKYNGSSLVATEPHNEDDCDFTHPVGSVAARRDEHVEA
jgi:hypothetical protein